MSAVFTRIVVPTDFSPCARSAWRLAQRLAAALGAELILTHVFVEGTFWSESPFNMDRVRGLIADQEHRATNLLEEWATEARAAGLRVAVALSKGAPHEEIVMLVRERRADLVVIGTHGRGGVSRAVLGSVADRVVRLAPCPVLTVQEGA